MASEPYAVGNIAVLTFKFRRTSDDTPQDPATVTVTVVKPDGTLAHPTASAASPVEVGTWRAEYTVDQPGDHWYYAAGAGGNATAVGRPRMFRAVAVPT